MQKKLTLVLTAAAALLLGFLIAFTAAGANPGGTFTVYGERETELPEPEAPGYNIEERGKIDVNTALANELADLPGIGPALAGRIVEYREANGLFSGTEDLLNVSGIGEKTLEGMLPYITVTVP